MVESTDLTNAILETAVDGIITIEENGAILMANPAATKMFGYKAEDLIGRSVSATSRTRASLSMTHGPAISPSGAASPKAAPPIVTSWTAIVGPTGLARVR